MSTVMNVGQLIEYLSTLPPRLPVYIPIDAEDNLYGVSEKHSQISDVKTPEGVFKKGLVLKSSAPDEDDLPVGSGILNFPN